MSRCSYSQRQLSPCQSITAARTAAGAATSAAVLQPGAADADTMHHHRLLAQAAAAAAAQLWPDRLLSGPAAAAVPAADAHAAHAAVALTAAIVLRVARSAPTWQPAIMPHSAACHSLAASSTVRCCQHALLNLVKLCLAFSTSV